MGRYRGQNDFDKIKALYRQNMMVTITTKFILSLVVFALHKPLISMFTTDSTVIALAAGVMAVDILVEVARAINNISEKSLNANGDVKTTFIVPLFTCWIFGVLLAYVLGIRCGLGLIGCWIGFAAFYSGETGEVLGNYVLLIKSDDDGETWSEPIVVVGGESEYRFYDECLWIDPMGRLWFTWAKAPANGLFASVCSNPDADVLEWSEEFFVGNDVMMNKPTVLSTGEWLFPIALWESGIGITSYECMARPEETGAFVYMTNDCGKSFSKIGNCVVPDRCFDEHMMVELNDGSIMMLIRNRIGFVKSYSYDGGKTWSKAVPFEIPVPSTRIFIRRLSSGRLLLICNNHESQRTNMTAFLSEDDGETWI